VPTEAIDGENAKGTCGEETFRLNSDGVKLSNKADNMLWPTKFFECRMCHETVVL
jgi:hypothetical protein